MAEQLGYFLSRLDGTAEGNGTLLDSSIVLYGSSNSETHNNRNYPLVLAGGSQLGFQHGAYRRFAEDVPLTNLFVSILNRVGVESERFADSTGPLSKIDT